MTDGKFPFALDDAVLSSSSLDRLSASIAIEPPGSGLFDHHVVP